MSEYTFYDPLTGTILGTYAGGNPAKASPPGSACIEGRFDAAQMFIEDAHAIQRAQMEIVVDGNVLRNLPRPCVLKIEGQEYTVEDGVAEIEFAYPGPYSIKLTAQRFIDTEVILP